MATKVLACPYEHHDPHTAYWNKPRNLDWPADKRIAQHD